MATGVTEETWNSLILDAAVVYANYGSEDPEKPERILGATNGGVTFGWDEFNVRSPEIDGLKGRLAGASRITAASPQITVSLVEWNLNAVLMVMPGCEIGAADPQGVRTIKRSKRIIPLADYPINLAMVGTQSGTGADIVILIKLPMVVDGAEIPTEDDSEATADITFVGHYDPANPEEEPWEIRWPTAPAPGVMSNPTDPTDPAEG